MGLTVRDDELYSRYFKNIFRSQELYKNSVVAFFATTAKDGKTYQVEHFNLDAILSVGYRVNSKRGTQFRIWANSVLKEYLMKGYSINNRVNRLEDKIEKIDHLLGEISFQLKTTELPTQVIFFDGQIFDAYVFFSDIIKKAQKEIILIDNYIDESTLIHLSKKVKNVKVILYTKTVNKNLTLDINKVNEHYGGFEVQSFSKSHDRFLILDGDSVYHVGASLKDLGKRPVVSEALPWFAFTKMEKESVENILKAIGR